MKLYELANEYMNILQYDYEGKYDVEGVLHILDSLEGDIKEKAIAVAAHIKNIEAEEKAIDEAVDKMAERATNLKKESKRYRDYLKFNLEKLDIKEINDSPYFKIKIKKNPSMVNIVDEGKIPDEYKIATMNVRVDKLKLKDELEQGVIIDGAELIVNTRVEIK
jgi:hypothetical protein